MQPRRADDGSHHRIHFRQYRNLFQRILPAQYLGVQPGFAHTLAQLYGGGIIQHHCIVRLEFPALPIQQIDLAVRR